MGDISPRSVNLGWAFHHPTKLFLFTEHLMAVKTLFPMSAILDLRDPL